MSANFIKKEVQKILTNKEFEYPLNFAMATAWIVANLKGLNLKILKVSDITPIADYYILASATNAVQARSMAEEIEFQFKPEDVKLISREGFDNTEWILLDYGDIIIHIFQDSVRDIFDMDDLWKNAPRVKIPTEFYQSTASIPSTDNKDDDGFF